MKTNAVHYPDTFPPSLKKPFQMKRLGLLICRQGNFQFSLNQKNHFAGAGDSVFIPEDGEFQVLEESEDMEVQILIYQIEPIRDIMGNLVVSMYMYSRLAPDEPSCVWSTGEEEEIAKYYMQERGVEFYADKLCLSPKYLSAVSKSISLLKNTQKDIQEISNVFGFPNASYFGTFFKKQVGISPQQYRKNL